MCIICKISKTYRKNQKIKNVGQKTKNPVLSGIFCLYLVESAPMRKPQTLKIIPIVDKE
jgi:hypothetical protein